jgi:hypothetical protein
MTANIQIIVDERQNASRCPTPLLRFKPNGEDAKSTGNPAAPRLLPAKWLSRRNA